MKTEDLSTEEIRERIAALGFSLKCSNPTGELLTEGREEPWQCVTYQVTVQRGGKAVWSGPFHLGLGHVKIPKRLDIRARHHLDANEERVVEMLQVNPRLQFKDRAQHARAIGKLAFCQKVVPDLADVLHSLVLDGAAHFDSQTFEDWAADYGYSSDSIKAKETFEACEETGKRLVRSLGRAMVDRLRDLLAQY